jgi:hypothetical protein
MCEHLVSAVINRCPVLSPAPASTWLRQPCEAVREQLHCIGSLSGIHSAPLYCVRISRSAIWSRAQFAEVAERRAIEALAIIAGVTTDAGNGSASPGVRNAAPSQLRPCVQCKRT